MRVSSEEIVSLFHMCNHPLMKTNVKSLEVMVLEARVVGAGEVHQNYTDGAHPWVLTLLVMYDMEEYGSPAKR